MENQMESESKICRTVKIDHQDGLHLRAEVLDSGNVLAARNETINGFQRATSTDFPVKQSDGSSKWYEEFPTKTDVLSGKSLLKDNELFRYDPKTDARGTAISKDSDEYKQANDSLAVLRAKYTPLAILELPACQINHQIDRGRHEAQ